MPLPKTAGDVWQFKAAVGWIRPDFPLLARAEDVLNEFIKQALKGRKKKDIRAANRITLDAAGWSSHQQEAWELVKKQRASGNNNDVIPGP